MTFLADQRGERKMVIGEVDKKETCKRLKAFRQEEKRNKRKDEFKTVYK